MDIKVCCNVKCIVDALQPATVALSLETPQRREIIIYRLSDLKRVL